jgi:hypothetical protein
MGQSARLENARNFSGILNEFRAYCGEIGDIFIAPRHFKISSAEDTGERSRVDDAQGFSQRRVIKRGAWAGEVGQTQFMPSSLILNSRSISTAAAAAILFIACPTLWPRPLISSRAMAGNVAAPGRQVRPISPSSRNGTRPTCMRGQSPTLRRGSPAASK